MKCAAAISSRLAFRRPPAQQVGQLGDVGGDAPSVVTGEQLSSRTTTEVILAIDEGERLLVGVAHDEARAGLLDAAVRSSVLWAWSDVAGERHSIRRISSESANFQLIDLPQLQDRSGRLDAAYWASRAAPIPRHPAAQLRS